MERPRVRLVFEDGHMLSKSQKSQGLEQSWLLLRPQHRTISDLSSYLLQMFDLYHSCPHGILLSMDGFVLPPFESISLLKDIDIIWIGNPAKLIEEVEVVDKKPCIGASLLLNGVVEKESGNSQNEHVEEVKDENALPCGNSSGQDLVCEKRKGDKILQSLKKKKQRSVAPDCVENDIQPRKTLHAKLVHNAMSKSNTNAAPELAGSSNNNLELTLSRERTNQLQEDGKGIEEVSNKPEGTKKLPSRNARRKKAKRKWLQEMAKIKHKRPHVYWYQEHTNTGKKDVAVSLGNVKRAPALTRGNGKVDTWEQFSEALNSKKTEVSQENCWKRYSSSWGSWPQRPLRGSKF